MTHPRAIIRDAFKTALLTKNAAGAYPTNAAERVFACRTAPINLDDDEELPAILVYAREEKRDPWKDYSIDGDDSWKQGELLICVEALVRASATLDDKLDAMAAQIEAVFEFYNVPGFEGSEVRLGDTNIDVITEGIKKPAGGVGLIYHIRYLSPWRVEPPEVAYPTVDVRIMGGAPERLLTNNQTPWKAP